MFYFQNKVKLIFIRRKSIKVGYERIADLLTLPKLIAIKVFHQTNYINLV